MTSDQWKDVSRIYAAAVQRPPSDRVAFVADACGEDVQLRREVELLLLEDGAPALVDVAVAQRASVMQVIGLNLGSMIGVFRIDALLGVGGMGEVYRARDAKLNRDVGSRSCLRRSPTIPSGWRASGAKRRCSYHLIIQTLQRFMGWRNGSVGIPL